MHVSFCSYYILRILISKTLTKNFVYYMYSQTQLYFTYQYSKKYNYMFRSYMWIIFRLRIFDLQISYTRCVGHLGRRGGTKSRCFNRIQNTVEQHLQKEQARFGKHHSCVDLINTLRTSLEQSIKWQAILYSIFMTCYCQKCIGGTVFPY